MTFRWLHISDIHFNFRQFDTNLMRRSLLSYLKDIVFLYKKIDAVFITGDFRFAPEKKYEEDSICFLHNILKVLNLTINDLYIVPGNHDVSRSSERIKIINNILEEYDPHTGDISERFFRYLYDDKIDFIEFAKKLYIENKERTKCYTYKNNPHFIVETEKVDILHLDTAFFSCKTSSDEHGQLILGTKYIDSLLNKRLSMKPIIALGHHPLSSLDSTEYNCIFSIFKKHNIHIYIAGHSHAAEIVDSRSIDLNYEIYQIFSSNLYYSKNGKVNFLIGEYNIFDDFYYIDAYYWNSTQNAWCPDNAFGLLARREDNRCVLYVNSIVGIILENSYEYSKYIEKDKEFESLEKCINFSNIVFAEKNCSSKMDLVASFCKTFNIFFDNSVIFKLQILKYILRFLNVKVDKNLMYTLCLLYACGKEDDSERFIEKSINILKRLGFSDLFCDICKSIDKNLSTKKTIEGEILRFIDIFCDFLLDNDKRKGLSVKAALKKIRLVEKNNLLFDYLIKAIIAIENIKIS